MGTKTAGLTNQAIVWCRAVANSYVGCKKRFSCPVGCWLLVDCALPLGSIVALHSRGSEAVEFVWLFGSIGSRRC